MRLDEAPLMERQDFTHLECRDVFMWNVLSTQRWLSAFCGISRALSLLLLSRPPWHPPPTDISFLPLKVLMGRVSCAGPCHLVESENVTKDNFSGVRWLKGALATPSGHPVAPPQFQPIWHMATSRERLSRLAKCSRSKKPCQVSASLKINNFWEWTGGDWP